MKISFGWLKDEGGKRFAPKTLISKVVNKNGKSLEVILEELKQNNENSDSGSGLNTEQLQNLVDKSLAQAKASGEFNGTDGKTAYQYAKDGGYIGTEKEFAKKLAQENPTKEEVNKLSKKIDDLKQSVDGGNSGGTISTIEDVQYEAYDGNLLLPSGKTKSSTGKVTSDKIPVVGGEVYLLTCSANYGNPIYVIYDSVDAVIASELSPNTTDGLVVVDHEITIPNGAVSMRIGCNLSIQPEGHNVSKKVTVTTSGTVTVSPLKSKKWVVIGDSLTEKNIRTSKNYHDYIAEETEIIVVNMGVGGTGYKNGEESGEAFYQRAVNIPADADIITIFGSGNDRNLTLGNPIDTGTDTVCGCINATIDTIHQITPTAWVGVITPTPWMNFPPYESDNKIALMSKAIVEICERRGIPCLDLYHCSGLRPWDENFRELAYSKDNGDGTHPDETGHAMIYPQIRSFLLGSVNITNAMAISKLFEEKANKSYVMAVFEELKNIIQNKETDSTIALLDSAILDSSILA